MKKLCEMTKLELIEKCEELSNEYDRLNDSYCEIENLYANSVNSSDDTIKDINHFKWRLQIEGLLTPQVEEFIENYLKYYND